MATALVYNPQQHSLPTMSRKTDIDTGQAGWSSPNPRYSNSGQNQSPYAHQDGYPTPVTGSATGFPQSQQPQAGPSRSRIAAAMQMEIDGMENKAREMTINEPSDGRVGVEKPCEHPVNTVPTLLTTSSSSTIPFYARCLAPITHQQMPNEITPRLGN